MAIIYKVTPKKKNKSESMNDRKAVIIFIMLSIVLLFGISILPRSPVPAASVTVTTTQ